MDLAFFRLPDGRGWIGEGPFKESASPPGDPAFYINDFELSDAKPWKTPARLWEIGADADLDRFLPSAVPFRVIWQNPETEWFKMVFRRIRRDVSARRLRKMVPVLTERGSVAEGDPAALLRRVFAAPAGFWSYARLEGDSGFLGATPELLLTRSGAKLQTMALAGTAKPSGPEDFTTNVKEIEEHELVANFLAETLESVGDVTREGREVSAAGGLTHFRTRFSVVLRGNHDDASLVCLLHPTPAVGCLPRDESSLHKLMDYRRQLGANPSSAPHSASGPEASFTVRWPSAAFRGPAVTSPCPAAAASWPEAPLTMNGGNSVRSGMQ